MSTIKRYFLAPMIIIMLSSFTANAPTENTEYKSVQIGQQVWMAQNLDVTSFRNGDPIEEVKNQKDWEKLHSTKKPAWCYYKNDAKNGPAYGKLYNFWAVSDPRGLAPTGWHVASVNEWNTLIAGLGGPTAAGDALKGKPGKSSSGFDAPMGGYRTTWDGFEQEGNRAYYWTSNPKTTDMAYLMMLSSSNGFVHKYDYFMSNGMSVRCVKD